MKRFVIEFGTGIDLHGGNPTKAAARAIDDAIHRCCLCGLQEIVGICDFTNIETVVKIGCPHSEQLDHEVLKQHLPFGDVVLICTEGGLATEGAHDGVSNRDEEIIVAVASLTVYINN